MYLKILWKKNSKIENFHDLTFKNRIFSRLCPKIWYWQDPMSTYVLVSLKCSLRPAANQLEHSLHKKSYRLMYYSWPFLKTITQNVDFEKRILQFETRNKSRLSSHDIAVNCFPKNTCYAGDSQYM